MADHIYMASLQSTTGAAQGPIATIVAAAAGAGRPPEIREIGVFDSSGVAATVGMGTPAAAGVTPTTSETVQALNALDPAGSTTLVTVHTTAPTSPANFTHRINLAAASGTGMVWVFGPGEFILKPGTQFVIWQLSTAAAVTYNVYIKVAE